MGGIVGGWVVMEVVGRGGILVWRVDDNLRNISRGHLKWGI